MSKMKFDNGRARYTANVLGIPVLGGLYTPLEYTLHAIAQTRRYNGEIFNKHHDVSADLQLGS